MRLRLLLVPVLSALLQTGLSQADSLFKVYLQTEDETRARSLFFSIQSKCQKELSCYQPVVQFLDTAEAITPLISRTHFFLANALFTSHLLEESKNSALRSIRKLGSYGPDRCLMLLHNTAALAYGHLSMVDSALFYAGKVDHLIGELHETTYAWRPDYLRYNAYVSIHQYDLALLYLKRSYGYLADSGDRMNKGFVLVELLRLTSQHKDNVEFDAWLRQYVRFQQEGKKSPDVIHANLQSLFKDDPDAIKTLEEKLQKIQADSTSAYSGIDPVTARMRLIDLYTRADESDKALRELKKLISDATTSDQVLHNAYTGLIENYEKVGNMDSAYRYAVLFQAFQERRYQQNLADQIAAYEVRFQTQEKDKAIAQQELTIQQNLLRQRSLWAAMLGLGLIALFTWIYYRKKLSYQHRIRLKDMELNQKRIEELEHRNKLLSLHSMIEGQEAERLRIAQDLHDGLGGLLTTVKAHFSAIQREMESLQSIRVFDQTNHLIDEACQEVRRIAHGMVPHSIQISGLLGAVEELVDAIRLQGIACDLEVHHFPEGKLNEQKAAMIYRIIQELTQNALKHSEAKRIHIQLLGHGDQLHIMVEDDGHGFDLDGADRQKGLGLKSIDSRIKYLGGNIQFDSSAQHGTVVNMEIPLSQ